MAISACMYVANTKQSAPQSANSEKVGFRLGCCSHVYHRFHHRLVIISLLYSVAGKTALGTQILGNKLLFIHEIHLVLNQLLVM